MGGGLVGEELLPEGRVAPLGGVDPDETYGYRLRAPCREDLQGVAIHDLDDDSRFRGGRGAGEESEKEKNKGKGCPPLASRGTFPVRSSDQQGVSLFAMSESLLQRFGVDLHLHALDAVRKEGLEDHALLLLRHPPQ